jgi:uncharacterized protein (TIGR02271 family)
MKLIACNFFYISKDFKVGFSFKLNKEPMDQTRDNDKENELEEGKSTVIPVIEEHAEVGKKVVETGKVIIKKKVHEETEKVDIPLSQETIDIDRITINKLIEEDPPGIRYQGDTMIIPVVKEVIVKRLMLVEELHIKKKTSTTSDVREIVLRRDELEVERINQEER